MITLYPMTEVEWLAYAPVLIREYAGDKVRAGNWPAEGALERSRSEVEGLLPDGARTGDHLLYSARGADGVVVGMAWLHVDRRTEPPRGFIYDLYVTEAHRRKGYGEQIMRDLEAKARALGLRTLSLHVFGFNRAAQALYAKLGYEVANIQMSKTLD